MLLSYFTHHNECRRKQLERERRISALGPNYHGSLSEEEKVVLRAAVKTVVANVKSGIWKPTDVLRAYGKQAVRAHEQTNCLTEVMIKSAEAWSADVNLEGPLAGMPVSLKDTVSVAGFDSCIGYSSYSSKPKWKNSSLVRLLRDAGAIPFVKTNVPTTLLSFESSSDVFGRTLNPHVKSHSPGGSTGGEAALLAFGGSRLGIGTDVAGSVRVPAHYSGIYTIKASTQRFPKSGNTTSMAGQDGVAAVYSPMTRTLEDLEIFWRAIVSMEPWKYDFSCLTIPWREVDISSRKNIKFGVMWSDGVVPPSPACKRALDQVISVLQQNNFSVVDFFAPDPYEGLKIASQLILADEGKLSTDPIRFWETNDPGMVQVMKWFRLPYIFKRIYAWYIRYVKGDTIYAGLLDGWSSTKSVADYFGLVAQRDAYRERWFNAWNAANLDFLLTVPNALPAVPHGGMKKGFKACGYSFLFNLLDYTAGVLPITHVDKQLDALEPAELKKLKKLNHVAEDAYALYDANAMHGLPVGVQIVGRRLEEEKVLEGMKLIDRLLRENGQGYKLLENL